MSSDLFDDDFEFDEIDENQLNEILKMAEKSNQENLSTKKFNPPAPIAFKPLSSGPVKKQSTLMDHFASKIQQQSNINHSKDMAGSNAIVGPSASQKMIITHPNRKNALSTHHKTDTNALETWIYPINYSIRDYQFNIAHSALFYNTLVCLPTGLGKTFIAAVVIYNYLSWFPEGRVVFMAPTKPLVNQQIDACFKITGIKKEITAELTGSIQAETRRIAWKKKRLLFMTPETFRNDIQASNCDVDKVVLVIFDEAHRASGNYAYCDIIKEMERAQCVFRVLALSATPGNDSRKVQAVIENLYIEKMQMRTEDSFDVQPFIHKKTIEELIIQPSQLLKDLITAFSPFCEKPLKRLVQQRAYYHDKPASASVYGMIKARETWRLTKHALPQGVQGMVEGDFGIAMTLLRFLDNLLGCGVCAFYKDLINFAQEVKQKSNSSKSKLELVNHPAFIKMMKGIEDEMKKDTFSSHPKLDQLVLTVKSHFLEHQKKLQESINQGLVVPPEQRETRVMVFSTFRTSVEEICALLEKESPLIRPTIFVGQAGGGAGSKKGVGMKQKDQIRVIQEFQEGIFNVIVATSIGEEGLDIGELDLIICFDNQKSPIRMLQRCGRTGRKRQGKICLLINEGAEMEAVRKARASYKAVQKSIVDGSKMAMYDGTLAAVLPLDSAPQCKKEALTVPEEEIVVEKRKKTANGKPMDYAQLLDYAQKNKIDFSKRLPCLDLARYGHWQTQELPVINVGRSALSAMFVSTMEFCEELREQEVNEMPSIKTRASNLASLQPQSSSQLIVEPPKKKQVGKFKFIPVLEPEKSMSGLSTSEADFLVDAAKRNIPVVQNLIPEPTQPVHFSPELIGDSADFGDFDDEEFLKSFAFNDPLALPVAANPLVDKEKVVFDDGMALNEVVPASVVCPTSPDAKSVNLLSDIDFSSGIYDDQDIIQAQDYNFAIPSIGALSKGRTDKVLIPITPKIVSVNKSGQEINYIPATPNEHEASSSIVMPINRRKNVIHNSSSAVSSSSAIKIMSVAQPYKVMSSNNDEDINLIPREKKKETLVERMARKRQAKRKGPRQRGTPQIDHPEVKLKHGNKRKRIMNNFADEFMDIEVDVSSGVDCSSDEEGSWLDQDLSGFIHHENSESQSEPHDLGFYRKVDEQKGENELKFGSKFKFSRGVRRMGSTASGGAGLAGSSINDSLGSLENFVCSDDEVEYDDVDDGLDSDKSKHADAEIEFKDDVEELDLDDMLDF